MSKAPSFKTEPWTDFHREACSILTDGFPHTKYFQLKGNWSSAKGNVTFKESYKKNVLSQEVAFWFPFNNGKTIYVKQQDKSIKVHYDHGIQKIQGYDVNFYGSVQSSKTISNIILKMGAICFWENAEYDNRLRWTLDSRNEPEIELGHKFYYDYKNFRFSILKVFDWTKFSMVMNALNVAYKRENGDQIFFKARNHTKRNLKKVDYSNLDTLFTDFAVDYVHCISTQKKVAAEIEFKKNAILGASAVYEQVLEAENAKRVKLLGKITQQQMSIATAYQSNFKDLGKWTVGCQTSYKNNKQKSVPEVKLGVQVDFNF